MANPEASSIPSGKGTDDFTVHVPHAASLNPYPETVQLEDTLHSQQQQQQQPPKRKRTKGPFQTPTVPLPRSSWSYLHLHLARATPSSAAVSLDIFTARTLLNLAMAQFLGHMGAAIPIDILRVDEADGEVWIRVPGDDCRAVVAALGQFAGSLKSQKGGAASGDADAHAVSWKVKGWDDWLGRLVMGGRDGGADLFED